MDPILLAVVMGQVLACVLIADFLSGLFHWMEDTFWTADTPLLGRWVIRHNIVHHHDPRAFTGKSWYRSARTTLAIGAVGLLIAWALGGLNWMTVLIAVIGVNANQIHKWSHRTRAENGAVIAWLQRLRMLQSPRHHARHHRDGKNTHYCVVTNLVNPVLDAVAFWRGLEFVLCDVIGFRRRVDDSVGNAAGTTASGG